MTTQPQPGETLGLSDTLEGITAVIAAYYGEERELVPDGRDRWALRSPAGNVMKFTYVYTQFDTFYFAFIPNTKKP